MLLFYLLLLNSLPRYLGGLNDYYKTTKLEQTSKASALVYPLLAMTQGLELWRKHASKRQLICKNTPCCFPFLNNDILPILSTIRKPGTHDYKCLKNMSNGLLQGNIYMEFLKMKQAE